MHPLITAWTERDNARQAFRDAKALDLPRGKLAKKIIVLDQFIADLFLN